MNPSFFQDRPLYQKLYQRQSLKSLLIALNLVLILSYLPRAQGLIRIGSNQRAAIKNYVFENSDSFAYFDVSYADQGDTIQADGTNTYHFSKVSQRSVSTYQYVKIPHNTGIPEPIYDKIQLYGYEIYGLCQHQGALDYVIGLNINYNEIRVMRIFNDTTSGYQYVKDFKKIDKDDVYKKLVGAIYVDCQYSGDFKGQSTYVIGIAGTYFHTNKISSYYLAKFSTKYNLTEYFVLSENQQIMESVRGVKVDLDNQIIYLAVEINKQKYFGRTVYQPGNLPGEDNANVAIHGYSWTHGVREWTTVIGNENYTDSFGRMANFGNSLFVFLNSYSTKYSTNTSQTDIYYYRLRASNGYIESQIIYGSPKDDRIFDLKITFTGLYILALIDDQFMPHKDNDKMWGTQNSQANLALIWMDFNDQIIDIESASFNNLPSPYPQKILVPRTIETTQSFVFVAPRTNDPIDIKGGFMITYYNDSNQVFSQSIGCGSTCSKCSPFNIGTCIKCKIGFYMFENLCYEGGCPDFSYPVFDSFGNDLKYCQQCHYTCKTCTGPTKDACSTCCTENKCGPIYNRAPQLGKCVCPVGLIDSNGFCVQRCTLNLAGKSNELCYPQCPSNSYPFIQYDQAAQAQERSQYDSSSQTDCYQSSQHLRFSTSGKGLAVQGQPDLTEMPQQYTIGFWVRPIALNTDSYFINAYGRVFVKAQSSTQRVFFSFKSGSNTFVEPVYTNDAKQRVSLNTWNYVVVAQKTANINNVLKFEQQLAISNTNMGQVQSAGFDNTKTFVKYPNIQNIIYIGAYSDQQPQSFTGYLKELKMFNKYHGFPQIQDEVLRMYRYYSFDDPNLVAYWKFTENFNANETFYRIRDYSINQNEVSYYKQTNPDYPTYVNDQSIALSLCIFHDVAVCRTPDYKTTHPMVIEARRLTSKPTFNFKDSSTLTKAQGDQVWFIPNNTQCIPQNIQAFMNYSTGFVNDWLIVDSNFSPVNLLEGVHYQICYYIAAQRVAFNVYQTYVVSKPKTVDPSNGDAFMSDGVTRTWNSLEGDQGYGDVIKFSLDCSAPSFDDYEMVRSNKPTYGQHAIKSFSQAGDFFFCWQPSFLQESTEPYYQSIYDLKYRIIGVPMLTTSTPTVFNMNEDLVRFDLVGTFADGDKIAFSWRGTIITDCNPTNFLGIQYSRNYFNWPSMWFGYTSGISGITNYTNDELHLCYLSAAKDAPQSWSRIKKTSGFSYQAQIKEYTLPTLNGRCPEPISFNPQYGSTELYETDNTVRFTFKSQAVYPSLQSNGSPGKIIIFRGAIRPDGSITRTNDILWSNTALNDMLTPNPFQQGDLICSGAGSCSIILSQQANKMKGGEIYYLSFYKESFAYKTSASSTTKYYLFNDKTLEPGQTTAYDHLFFCRSFTINPSTQLINGRKLTMTGLDLRSKQIKARFSGSSIATALFTTKSINLVLSVINTASSYCIRNPPVATVQITDVTQTSFTIQNLELRQCNSGTLMADIQLNRGIQDQYGVFTHVRSEWQKGVSLGQIGCHDSCMFCNGTTFASCLICQDQNQKLLLGQCFVTCPQSYPYYKSEEVIMQRFQYKTYQCLRECPLGYYPNPQTNECMECNPDCQTCNSNYISSCLTCEPIKYVLNGICLEQCPTPHHKNNFTSYKCDQISDTSFLKVKIQSLGYKSKIPKDVQQYLKASISNEGGGDILSILWEQLEPSPDYDEISVFTTSSQGDVQNREAVIKMKMTALNYMASDQVVKVKVTVQNSLGEIAYDIYEFFQNQPPTVGNSTITVLTNPGLGNGTSIDSIFKMTLTNWEDTLFHGDDPMKFKLYMTINGEYFTLTDQTEAFEIYYRLPFVSNSITSGVDQVKTLQICVQCIDSNNGYAYDCQKISNIQNTPKYLTSTNDLIKHLNNLNFNGNMSNLIYASNLLYVAMDSPKRTSSSPGICTLDYHCNYNGICTSRYGNQRCVCELGFSGTFCQFKESQLQDLQNIEKSMISSLHTYLSQKYEITSNDIEIVASSFRGMFKDPDLSIYDNFQLVIDIITMIGEASIYAHSPLSSTIRAIYLESMASVIYLLHHSASVRRAFPESDALALGFTLSQQYQQQNGRILQKGRNLLNEDVPYLIGGMSSRYMQQNSKKRNLAESQEDVASANDDQNIYQKWGRIVDKQLNQFINKLIPTLNPQNKKFTFTSEAFDLLAFSQYASAYKDQTMFIREKDLYWTFPDSIFERVQGSASDKHEVNFKALKYSANPLLFEEDPGGFVESNVTQLSFYDSSMNHINVVLNDYVLIKEPYRKTQGYENELMRCMSWNETKYKFESDDSCSVQLIKDNIPCYSCEEEAPLNAQISLCRCKHLSTFAVVYQQTFPQTGRGVEQGIYSDFFAMQYWRNSFGYFAVITGVVVFFIGQIIMYYADKKLQPPVMEKLRERIRKLEMKGFTQKPTQKKLIVKRGDDGNIIFIRNNLVGEEEKNQGKMIDESTPITHLKKPSESLKSKKKALSNSKKFNKDDDMVQEAQMLPVKGKKKPAGKSQKYPKDEDRVSTDKGMDDDLNNDQSSIYNQGNDVVDHDLFEQQMQRRYEEEKEIQEFVKLHGTSSSEEDMEEKMRSKEQKRYLKIEKKSKELYWYHWKSLLIHGNHLTSILYITSILAPRHARWTLLYMCILLNWFWCAVIYNNTKDPLEIPDFVCQRLQFYEYYRIKAQEIQQEMNFGQLLLLHLELLF
ncbi:neurohypophysial n-terminal domain containing protein [Stylonychia lemnae]|uniref:Neurohypophysial n-terminal domain containing protein n=1 Tax=Stylonychia lemnae TaxID=5949 RepID=A0A078B0R4_STYLE|nr:neurohypophysial n-terminal domain containing protein [Stylonychia lemnae]|eukprot:CDW88139.1 neurohypophysial n-terminal domain containing protein [Stylonychia lemnae]